MQVKTIYQIRVNEDQWQNVLKGVVQANGWLHYELRDGTVGLASPKNWRSRVRSVKEESKAQKDLL
jgi:hypothetical protein